MNRIQLTRRSSFTKPKHAVADHWSLALPDVVFEVGLLVAGLSSGEEGVPLCGDVDGLPVCRDAGQPGDWRDV
jgi:hypothetical protein